MQEWIANNLPEILKFAAALQLVVALLNLNLVRILDRQSDLARMPLLLRQVFHVHLWFISITLTIFAVMTWRFAGEMCADENTIARWLAGAIGVFWLCRTLMQACYYSPSHWRGRRGPTLVHVTLLFAFGGLTLVYGLAFFGGAS